MTIGKKSISQLLNRLLISEDFIGENGLLKDLTEAIPERTIEHEMRDSVGLKSVTGCR